MEQISANELYNRILNSGLLSARGAINFELNGTSVTIKTTDIVGNCIQSWLKQWMIDNNIYCSEPHNTQIFPDFYLSNETTTNLLEVKAFNYNASPAFDIANFEAYCASLESAKLHIKRVRSFIPSKGLVSILTITDKQYADIINIWGAIEKKSPQKPMQLEIF